MDLKTLADRIVGFLRDIGLAVETRALGPGGILPGISVEGGVLLYDPEHMLYPGDLLHEAGHLAVTPPAERASLGANVGPDGGMEMGAIAWSWAACLHLEIPPEVVFHPAGYRGGAASLIENFRNGYSMGVPILEWRGLTDFQQPGAKESPTRFPKMKKWLCE